jgi:succinate dehydrogenase / fumarate reductase cytochrome b subunit
MAETRPAGTLRPRPLSPHLQIYRWTWTMTMSIAHRATGIAIYAGTLLLTWWLLAAASGPGPYAQAYWALGSWLGVLVLIGFTWALIHHSLGGIKHLFQDVGIGFGPDARVAWAIGTLVGSVVLTILVWVAVWYVTR